MSSVKIKGNDNGTGILYLNAPNTNTDRTLTIPDESGTILTDKSGVTFRASKTSLQTGITSATAVKVTFTEQWDTNNDFSGSTFQPSIAGYYQINANITFVMQSGATGAAFLMVYKNGVEYARGDRDYGGSAGEAFGISYGDVVHFNGTTDTLEIYAYQNSGVSVSIEGNGLSTFISGFLVKAD